MTHIPPTPEPPEAMPRFTCADVTAQLFAYATGTLDDRAARALEWHAAHCAQCEPLIDRALHGAPRVPDASALADQVPLGRDEADHLRRATLNRVRRTRTNGRVLRKWTIPVGALLAASLLLLARTPRSERAAARADATAVATDSSWAAFPGATSAPMRAAVRLAQAQAAPEFAALDTATREIERAIAAAPDDDALRDFREALDARRRELEARVARVTE